MKHGCTVRRARIEDVPAPVAPLADDPIGHEREYADPAVYEKAFRQIDAGEDQLLAYPVDGEDVVAGTVQPTVIPDLSRGGALRAQIENWAIADALRFYVRLGFADSHHGFELTLP